MMHPSKKITQASVYKLMRKSWISLDFQVRRWLLPGVIVIVAHVGPASSQEVSSLQSIPDAGVNIRVESPENQIENEVSARFTNESDLRGLAQTFVWNSDSGLSGIGIKIGNGMDGKQFFSAQTYTLDIQELNGSVVGRRVVETIASLSVVIDSDAVVPGEYLFIALPEPILLEDGKSYGFHLRPAEINPRSWLFVMAVSESVYDEGTSCQTVGDMIYEGEPYGIGRNLQGNRFNFLFFTTTDDGGKP